MWSGKKLPKETRHCLKCYQEKEIPQGLRLCLKCSRENERLGVLAQSYEVYISQELLAKKEN